QLEKDSPLPHGAVQIDQRAVAQARAVELLPEEMENLAPESLAALPAGKRMERNLNGLLRMNRAIGSLRDQDSLPWQLLGMTFDVIPAERGAVLLFEDGSSEMRSQVAWDRTNGPEHPVHISQQLITQAVEGKQPLWNSTNDGTSSSFLCAPMVSEKSVLGIL